MILPALQQKFAFASCLIILLIVDVRGLISHPTILWGFLISCLVILCVFPFTLLLLILNIAIKIMRDYQDERDSRMIWVVRFDMVNMESKMMLFIFDIFIFILKSCKIMMVSLHVLFKGIALSRYESPEGYDILTINIRSLDISLHHSFGYMVILSIVSKVSLSLKGLSSLVSSRQLMSKGLIYD